MFAYETEVSVIAAPPDWKVTTGSVIVSGEVTVRVTTSSALAKVVVELLEAMLTALKVGAMVSLNQAAVGVVFQLAVAPKFEIIAVAPLNIEPKLVTLPTFQPRIS